MNQIVKPVANNRYSDYFTNKSYRFFDGKAKDWEYVFKCFLFGARKWAKGSKILDIGCGTGTLLLFFGRKGYECYGVDFDSVQIEAAKKMAQFYESDNIVFEKAGMQVLPFADDFFDITTSKDVVEHLPNHVLEDYLQQSYKCLKEEGILMIFTKPTKYTYLFSKSYVFLLLPFVFMVKFQILKYLSFLDNWVPRLYKKITGKNMKHTWQDPPPEHCNCPELEDLSRKVKDANFELIMNKGFISPNQIYFKFIHRLFPYDFVKPNIFIVARKQKSN